MMPDPYDGAGGASVAYRLTIPAGAFYFLKKAGHLPRDGSTLDMIGAIAHFGFGSEAQVRAWIEARHWTRPQRLIDFRLAAIYGRSIARMLEFTIHLLGKNCLNSRFSR